MKIMRSKSSKDLVFFFFVLHLKWLEISIKTVLNKLIKPELVQLLLNAKAKMGAQISTLITEVKELNNCLKNLEADFEIN